MPQVQSTRKVVVKMTLDETEAKWLMTLCQNHAPNEPMDSRRIRKSFFDILSKELGYGPAPSSGPRKGPPHHA